MTYLLQTTNNGQIEAGYFSIIVDRVRFSDPKVTFSVYTPNFAQVVAALASGKEERYFKIIEDGTSWALGGYDPQKRIVSIGHHDIAAEEFGAFADYVFRGGFCGWGSDKPAHWRPDFVVEAREKVEKYLRWRKKESAYLQYVNQKELPRLEDVLKEI